jgi:hypothetical protein
MMRTRAKTGKDDPTRAKAQGSAGEDAYEKAHGTVQKVGNRLRACLAPITFSLSCSSSHLQRMVTRSTILWSLLLAGVAFQVGWTLSGNTSQQPCESSGSDPVKALVAPSKEMSYSIAYDESLQFFDDIPAKEWDLLKQKVHDIQPNTCPTCWGGLASNAWYQNNYEPEFNCRHEKRIGKLGDGGKWICDPHRLAKASDCLVYSVGSNNDFSFEQAVKDNIGQHCEIHTFDPADYASGAEKVGSTYHQWGIDGTSHGEAPQKIPAPVSPTGRTYQKKELYKTLKQTVEELGHTNRTIDLFKIDCEGCELKSHQTWFEAPVTLRQILVEVHDDFHGRVRVPQVPDFYKNMYRNNYVIYHKEPNIQFNPGCVEYGFLKLDRTFFAESPKETQKKLKE